MNENYSEAYSYQIFLDEDLFRLLALAIKEEIGKVETTIDEHMKQNEALHSVECSEAMKESIAMLYQAEILRLSERKINLQTKLSNVCMQWQKANKN